MLLGQQCDPVGDCSHAPNGPHDNEGDEDQDVRGVSPLASGSLLHHFGYDGRLLSLRRIVGIGLAHEGSPVRCED